MVNVCFNLICANLFFFSSSINDKDIIQEIKKMTTLEQFQAIDNAILNNFFSFIDNNKKLCNEIKICVNLYKEIDNYVNSSDFTNNDTDLYKNFLAFIQQRCSPKKDNEQIIIPTNEQIFYINLILLVQECCPNENINSVIKNTKNNIEADIIKNISKSEGDMIEKNFMNQFHYYLFLKKILSIASEFQNLQKKNDTPPDQKTQGQKTQGQKTQGQNTLPKLKKSYKIKSYILKKHHEKKKTMKIYKKK